MNDRDKSTLECPEKMCDYCCNFDKEHIGMDGMALCKLTMTLAYAEDYGGNCMFYNVPKEQIIVPPCKVGDRVYRPSKYLGVVQFVIISFKATQSEMFYTDDSDNIIYIPDIGKTVFLTKEEAENALKEREG